MIQWIDTVELKKEALEFCSNSLCGTRISSFLEAYGTDYSFARFWLQKNDDMKVTAVLSCVDGVATLEACPQTDFDELSAFLPFCGMSVLFTKESTAEKLSLKTISKSISMVYKSGNYNTESDSLINHNSDLKDVYHCLSLSYSKDDLPPFDEWLPDISYRIRHKTASVFTIDKDNVCISTAMAIAESPTAVILGGVATVPQFRNRGYAKTLISYCTQRWKNEKKKIFLCCEEDKVRFYNRLGFEVGEFYSISTLK